MNIIWGYGANPHITAQQLRDTYVGIFGSDTHILDVGSKMAATIVSATEVEIADGVLIAQGCTANINYGQTESLTIQNGTQGMLRKDLIVAQYMKSTGFGVESMSLAVKRGTPAASSPALPAYTTGSIADGDTLAEFPLYVVNLDGINITSVQRLVDVVSIKGGIDDLADRVTAVETDLRAVKRKAITRTVTIPAGTATMTDTTIDFSSDIPATARLVGTIVSLGNFCMPYVVNGTVSTWISKMNARSIVISNKAGAYPSYTMYATLFYV
jgi:hypothetical protein